jgi:hypothetical protein
VNHNRINEPSRLWVWTLAQRLFQKDIQFESIEPSKLMQNSDAQQIWQKAHYCKYCKEKFLSKAFQCASLTEIQDFRNTRPALEIQAFPPCRRLLQKFSRSGTVQA